jgi:hypothetical protein
VSSPALANEGRVELRTGIAWVSGVSDETIGIAAGYDADVSENVFVGVEAVADTDFNFVSPTLGVNARLGTKVMETGRLFALAGYAYETQFDFDDAVVGVGFQQEFGTGMLVSLQYQRYVDTEVNRVAIGLGARF